MAYALSPRAIAAGYRLACYDSIGSTNAEALARARKGDPGRLWIAARAQSAGRGRRGNRWIAPKGNLAASLLMLSDVSLARAATLGFVAGLALDAALCDCAPHLASRLKLKWPNDVLADDKKLAGILLESEALAGGLAIVIGLGANVVAAPAGLPVPAVALAALGASTTAQELFSALSETWLDCERLWNGGHGMAAIRSRWLARAAGVGGGVTMRVGGKTLRGIFETLDEEGKLILRDPDGGVTAIAAGEAHFGDAATSRSEAEAR